jgi:inosine triphosphate pyrophosphatase
MIQGKRLIDYSSFSSKWFAKSLGPKGLNNMLEGFEDKTACATCIFAYAAGPDREPLLFEGKTQVMKRSRSHNVTKNLHLMRQEIVIGRIPTIFTPPPILTRNIPNQKGKIVQPRGPQSFAWDTVFEPEGFDQTYAEMNPSVKNTISHRYKALKLLKEYLEQNSYSPKINHHN